VQGEKVMDVDVGVDMDMQMAKRGLVSEVE
jgi:hypothetical protein